MAAVRVVTKLKIARDLKLYSAVRHFSSGKIPEPISDDPVTHTGQKWDKEDYRLVRFEGRPKHVNPNFAYDLINSVPPEPKEDRVVWCDGGSGPTGHPKVFINLDKPGNHACGYCGLRFYKDDKHSHH